MLPASDSGGMEWRDEGTLISSRLHGETSAIIEVFTAQHGRHAGVVRGGASRKAAAMLQPGTQVAVQWRARLDDHLGVFTVEPVQSRAGLMADRLALAGLNAICAMLHFALPEREPHGVLYDRTQGLLAAMPTADWPAAYLRWELALLEEVGFALDLALCRHRQPRGSGLRQPEDRPGGQPGWGRGLGVAVVALAAGDAGAGAGQRYGTGAGAGDHHSFPDPRTRCFAPWPPLARGARSAVDALARNTRQ